MRVINNKNENTDLLLNLYYPYIKPLTLEVQVESIRFEPDCIHIIGLDGKLLDEMTYFLSSVCSHS
jgi:hypothetical protein